MKCAFLTGLFVAASFIVLATSNELFQRPATTPAITAATAGEKGIELKILEALLTPAPRPMTPAEKAAQRAEEARKFVEESAKAAAEKNRRMRAEATADRRAYEMTPEYAAAQAAETARCAAAGKAQADALFAGFWKGLTETEAAKGLRMFGRGLLYITTLPVVAANETVAGGTGDVTHAVGQAILNRDDGNQPEK